MSQSKEHVRRFFSERVVEWSAHYADLEPRSLATQNLLSRQRFALEMVGPPAPRALKILDAGCGTGEVSAKLIDLGHEVWGLDFAEPMIRHVRARFPSDRFWIGDIEHMPFADDTFDAVVCLGVVEYLDSDEQALREIWRVLKPGGRAVVSTPSAISPLHHMDRMLGGLMAAARPFYHLVKYRQRRRECPVDQPGSRVTNRRYYRGSWLRLLRSVGFEPDAWICHGWGWYKSGSSLVAQVLWLSVTLSRKSLERFLGRAGLLRAGDGFVRNRALNWLASEQIVRIRAIKSTLLRMVALCWGLSDLVETIV
jgi:SAM-dependent methyltransferase